MNILDKSAICSCTSCQMCGAVCAMKAITISLDKEGFYRPSLDENLCVDCGLCVKVCNKFDNNINLTDETQLQLTKLFAASAKSDVIVRKTTSGGIADLLAKHLIDEGYKVIGVVYDSKQNNTVHKVATTADDTDAFRGSKYIQSYSMDAFRELVKGVHHEKYAVFGLPCQIYAMSRYLDVIKKRENCILIDLYCHGCPSMHVWTKVSEDLRAKMQTSTFKNAIWRSKYRGWGNFVLEVIGDNGKRFVSTPMHNEFFDLFFCNQVLNESCTYCKLRGTLAYTDIRLGDFWGKEFDKTFRGMSGVSLVTDRAKDVFSKISSNLDAIEKPYSSFLPYQSWSHVYKIDGRMRSNLFSLLADTNTSIKDCVRPLVARRSLKSKIILLVKQALIYMPNGIEWSVRKIIK